MDAKSVSNMPLPTTEHFTVGSFTTANLQAPQGEVMKLTMLNLEQATEQPEAEQNPAFGTHIREAVAIVKDWAKNP